MAEKPKYQFVARIDDSYYWIANAETISVITCPVDLFWGLSWGNTGIVREIWAHQPACQCSECLLSKAREWRERLREFNRRPSGD